MSQNFKIGDVVRSKGGGIMEAVILRRVATREKHGKFRYVVKFIGTGQERAVSGKDLILVMRMGERYPRK